MRKILSAVLVLMMLVSLLVPSVSAAEAKSDDIVILYTNDVHTYVDKPLGYDVPSRTISRPSTRMFCW